MQTKWTPERTNQQNMIVKQTTLPKKTLMNLNSSSSQNISQRTRE